MQETVIKEIFQSNSVHSSGLGSIKKTKASFAGCPVSDRKLFKKSNCIIPISIMGSKEHEGNRFLATMQLVNASFKSCTLLIGDGLHRHTLKIEHPEEDEGSLHKMALILGDQWFLRNRNAYENLRIPYKIVRWSNYLEHPDFNRCLQVVSSLYKVDETYKNAIEDNGKQYLSRYANKGICFNAVEALSFCVAYLKEECATMCLWAEEGYLFELYPTGRCLAMDVTYQRLIQPLYRDRLKPVSLRFKK